LGLSLEQKQAMVSEVQAKLAGAQAVIVAEYRGLNVERVTQLRVKARKSGLYLRVLKNTLARRAVKGTPFEKLTESMTGPLMYGIASDPVAGAKVLSEFAKDNELFVIRGGAMPNAVMSAKDIKALAMLPSRQELLAKLGGSYLLVTRGSRGMALFDAHGLVEIPVHGTDQVADVTGAGDTVISTFSLALACGATPLEAASLANVAGGVVVMKRGTATVSPEELADAIASDHDTQ